MGSISMGTDLCDAVAERARGVVAERFAVEIAVADVILGDVARVQKRTVADLAAAVVPRRDDSRPLPRRLCTNKDDISDAA